MSTPARGNSCPALEIINGMLEQVNDQWSGAHPSTEAAKWRRLQVLVIPVKQPHSSHQVLTALQ